MAKEKVRKSIELFPLRVADLSGKEFTDFVKEINKNKKLETIEKH